MTMRPQSRSAPHGGELPPGMPRLPGRRRLLSILALRCLLVLSSLLFAMAARAGSIDVELYVGEGCPHCAAARGFLDDVVRERPEVELKVFDVRADPQALSRLQTLAREAGIAQPGVPTIRIGTTLVVGFDSPATTGARLRALLDSAGPATPPATEAAASATVAEPACPADSSLGCKAPDEPTVALPFGGGTLSVNDVGLPLFTVIIGALDGFNPCSMWVLILMIGMLASLQDRQRMLAIVGTFVAVQAIAYYAFMAAWLNLFLLIGLSRASEIAIGCLAIIAGAINLKDVVAPGRGVSLSIPQSARPGIYERLRAILNAERLWPAIAGVIVLGVLVQIVELMCTSGFPALYTRILTLRTLDPASYYGYLALYDAMYMLDDIGVLGIGVVTLSGRRLQEKEGRLLKLIAGLAMIGLGAYLLLSR